MDGSYKIYRMYPKEEIPITGSAMVKDLKIGVAVIEKVPDWMGFQELLT